MIVYRVGEWNGDSHTAREIIDYETKELGNSLDISPEVLGLITRLNVPGKDLLWACISEEATARYKEYGSVMWVEIPDDSLVIGHDRDGGYLLWLGGKNIWRQARGYPE